MSEVQIDQKFLTLEELRILYRNLEHYFINYEDLEFYSLVGRISNIIRDHEQKE